MKNRSHLLLLALVLPAALARAAEPEEQLDLRLQRCAPLGDASARLACYDALAKAAPDGAAAVAAARADAPVATQPAPPPAPPQVSPKIAQATTIPPQAALSPMVQHWELDQSAKRGVFNFREHYDNYLLLANYSNSTNDGPFEDYTPAGIKAKHVELTYEISFKVKLMEQIAQLPLDLWFGYTQQSYWQAYNRAASSPFRETNYQPELMLVTPLNFHIGDFALRYANLGLMHQSNGQTSTLSRSWNRVYGELGMEDGPFELTARLWKRLDNARSDNDNIDIVDYMGHGDLRLAYHWDGNEISMLARHNLQTGHGALQLDWAFPLAANLKGYVQGFSGYGESLIDYNYSQKSVGAGFLVDF